jgi:peptidyl-prolyl cis-trans isomerase C
MHKNIIKTGLAAVALITLLSSCGAEKPEGNTLAKVNRQAITDTSVNDRIASFPENARNNFKSDAGKNAILEQLINEELLLQEAKKSGYEKNEDYKTQVVKFEKQFNLAKQQALINLILKENVESKITVSEEDISAYYAANPKQFEAFEQREASHILLKTEAEAAKYLQLLRQKKASFSDLAKKHSIDPTAKNGGDLGWFKKGDLVPAFEKAAFALKYKGSISDVVKTQFGFHIIKLTDIKTVEKRKLENVKSQIQQALYSQKRNAVLSEYVDIVKKNHKITKTEKKDPVETK